MMADSPIFATAKPMRTNAKLDKKLYELMFDFTLSTLKPWQMDYFFRWLIARLEEDTIEDAEVFLEFVQEKLCEKQKIMRATILAVVKKYRAVLRVQRSEQANGVASLDLKEDLAQASKEAEDKLESVKT